MSKKPQTFNSEAKARIARAEVAKHGHIRKDSFSRDVQSKVDKQVTTRSPEPQVQKSRRPASSRYKTV